MKKNVIIAVVLLVALGLLYWGIEFLKGVNLFEPTNYYLAKFEKIDGLNVSAPVTVNGFQVGLVKEINYDYKSNGITVKMSLDEDLKIPVGSSVMQSSELLGAAALELKLAKGTAYYKVGDVIPSTIEQGMLDKVTGDLMPQVNEIMPHVSSIINNVNALTSNPALTNSVGQFDDVVSKINASAGELSVLMANLNQLSQHLNGSVPGVMSGVAGIESKVDATVTDLHTNLNTLTTSLNSKVSQVPVEDLQTTVKQLNATLANLQQITTELNAKMADRNSTLGLLLNDRQLYDNANGAVMSLDSLLTDIKANPKRYITIKVF